MIKKRKKQKIAKDICAVVDIGTSKIIAAIGYFDTTINQIRVMSKGYQASKGVTKGQIIDKEALEQAIVRAVFSAEQGIEETLNTVRVNISGSHLLSERIFLEEALPEGQVSQKVIDRIVNVEAGQVGDNRYKVLYATPIAFQVDKQAPSRTPVGQEGHKLKAHLHVVTGETAASRAVRTAFKRAYLEVKQIHISGIASAYGTAVPDEMARGVTVIDIGAGVTDLAIFYNNTCVHCGAIPIGGNQITQDIAHAFSIPFFQAERLKTLYGNAIVSSSDREERISLHLPENGRHTADKEISVMELNSVIQPRVEEIFSLIKKHLAEQNLQNMSSRGFILTGGSSQLPGMREVGSRGISGQIRLGRPYNIHGVSDEVLSPSFATSAGLLNLAINRQGDWPKGEKSTYKQIGAWIKENF